MVMEDIPTAPITMTKSEENSVSYQIIPGHVVLSTVFG